MDAVAADAIPVDRPLIAADVDAAQRGAGGAAARQEVFAGGFDDVAVAHRGAFVVERTACNSSAGEEQETADIHRGQDGLTAIHSSRGLLEIGRASCRERV